MNRKASFHTWEIDIGGEREKERGKLLENILIIMNRLIMLMNRLIFLMYTLHDEARFILSPPLPLNHYQI